MNVSRVKIYSTLGKLDNGESPLLLGDTSSNGCFSSVMLVFGGVGIHIYHENTYTKFRIGATSFRCVVTFNEKC